MRILLVDDHAIVRHGIRELLLARMPGAEVEELGDAATALAWIRAAAWDVIVLDLTMPGMSGLDLLKTVRAERRELPVLVLSMHPAAQFAQRVIDAGGAGYVTKDAAPEELVAAIHRVQRGGVYRPVSELTAWRRPRRAPHEQLSDREYQVLRLMGAGLGVSRIASDLGLSVKTVSTYRARVLEKLGLETSAQLIRYAVENSLVDG